MIWNLFFEQLIFGISSLLITYVIGQTILSFFSINEGFFFRLFVKYIVGITTIVLIYSIIKTHGKTVNILLLPIISTLLYHFRGLLKKPFLNKKEIFKELLWSLIPFLCVFLYQSWFFFDFSNGWIHPLFRDFHAYASFSNSLKISGIENPHIQMTYFFPEKSGLFPYHYPELWLTAVFSEIFNNATINTFYFIMYPILVTIFVLGLSSLFQNKIKKNILKILISILLLFVTGFNFFRTEGGFGIANFHILGFLGVKLAWVYVFLLLGFITWNKNKMVAIYSLIAIPIFSATFLPAIWGGFILYFLGAIINHLPKISKKHLIYLLFVFLMMFIYFLFYHFLSDKNINAIVTNRILGNEYVKFVQSGLRISKFKLMLGNFVYYMLPKIFLVNSFLFYLLPFILLILNILLKQHKAICFLSILFLIGGAFAFTLLYGDYNSWQFSVNLISIILSLVLIEITYLIDNFTNFKIQFIILLSLYILLLIINTIAERHISTTKNLESISEKQNFIKETKDLINEKVSPICIFYKKETYLKIKSQSILMAWTSYNDFVVIDHFNTSTHVFFLGNPELYLNEDRLTLSDSIVFYKQTPLNVWRSNGNQNDFKSFIKHYKIKYFYFQNGVIIPEFIANNIDTLIESQTTNSKFIKIKKDFLD